MTSGTVLDRALRGCELSADEGDLLFQAELDSLIAAADDARRSRVGDSVSYVVNRNINFTNICTKRCAFCAFSRSASDEDAFSLSVDEIVRRTREAASLGATEVCLQAGLMPGDDGRHYLNICRAIKWEAPDIHIHGFSPEEVSYGVQQSGLTVEDYLGRLKDAGVGSLPGTSAEILDDAVRQRISPGRISTDRWVEIVRTAHRLGIPTSATIMYGHLETSRQIARQFVLFRRIQQETGGFTELVPLSFIGKGLPSTLSWPGALRIHAVARLMLGGWIDNIQVSWVKHGPELASQVLSAGANDFGGTLMNESISAAAGAGHGEFLSPQAIRTWIRSADRIPVQRSTTYQTLRVFEMEPPGAEAMDLWGAAACS